MEEYKTCSVCKQILALSDFPNKNNTKTGKASACKPCHQAQKTASYHRNKETAQAYNKKYYAENKESEKARVYKWVKENPQRHHAKSQRWRKANPQAVNNISQKRRAKLKDAETFFIRPSFLKRLYASPCLYCGSRNKITADHVIPIELNGRHSEGNLVPACGKCNSSKGFQYLSTWKAKRATPKRDPQ